MLGGSASEADASLVGAAVGALVVEGKAVGASVVEGKAGRYSDPPQDLQIPDPVCILTLVACTAQTIGRRLQTSFPLFIDPESGHSQKDIKKK